MAQLKDSIVSGNLRVTDTTLTDTLQVTTIKAPTTSGGTAYGPGTSGQVLKSNGTTTYWASDSNSDINVTQTATTTDAAYEILFSGTADNTTRTETARKNSNLKFNPSTGSLYANYMYAGGSESQSAYPAGGYHIYDCRSVNVTPANGDKSANFYFHMTDTPDTSKWWGVMHVKGWTGAYSAWEIAGPAHNVDQKTTPLYVRTSNASTAWGSWRKIYDTANKPTASEVGALSTSTKYALSTSVGGNAILSDGLATKTLTSETIDTTAGSFVFGGTDLIGNASYDWAGIQVDASNDSFQLTVNGQLIFRQNDSNSKTSENWGEWKGCLTTSDVVGSGGITVTQNDITIGTGDGAYSYKGSVTISHSNSITASTSTVFKKFSYDSHGHITDIANVAKSDITALGIPAQDTKYGISGAYGANSNTWVTTITAGGSGATSTVPTASISAYGITKLYNGVDSTSTGLAATANAVKTAYDKANHSHPYLPLAGGTLTGALTLKNGQYSGNYGLDCANSDVIGVNSIRFADSSGDYTEGISFPRTTAGHWDTIWANGGEFYFTPDHETDVTGATSYKVLHTNNTSFTQTPISSGTKIGTITIAGTPTDIYAPSAPTVNNASLTLKGSGTTVTTFTANASTNQSLDIVAGSNVTITPDATNHKITIASSYTNTDANVTQTATTTNADYEILFSATADNTTRTETARKNSNLKFNPSTGSLYASKYYGEFECLNEVADDTSYAMVLAANPNTHQPNTLRKTPNVVISFKNGTASEEGWTQITLGNSTPSGTAGNETGWLKLYSPSSGVHYITGASTTSAITHTLPATTGTILNSGTTSFTQSLSSGTKIGSIKINGTPTDIYAPTNTDTKVTQTVSASSNTSFRPLLLGASWFNEGGAPSTVTDTVMASHRCYIQPSTGDITLYSPSGDSPGLIFKRGTNTDNLNDWKIYDKGGMLYFARNTSGSSTWADYIYFDKSTIYAHDVKLDGGIDGGVTINFDSSVANYSGINYKVDDVIQSQFGWFRPSSGNGAYYYFGGPFSDTRVYHDRFYSKKYTVADYASSTSYGASITGSFSANRNITIPDATGTIPLITEIYNNPSSTATSQTITDASQYKFFIISAKLSDANHFDETTAIIPMPSTTGEVRKNINFMMPVGTNTETRLLNGAIVINYSSSCVISGVVAGRYLLASTSSSTASSISTGTMSVYITRIVGISY